MPSKTHFKALPWDFLNQRPKVLSTTLGKFALYGPDSFLEQIVRDQVSGSFEAVRKITGEDLTIEWLESEFKTLSLFNENHSYIVVNADKVSTKVKDFLLNESFDVDGRFLLLCFQKEKKFFEKLKKQDSFETLEIQAPRFWEGQKHLEHIADYHKVRLPYDVQSYLVKNLEQNSYEYWNALNVLKLQEGEITVQSVSRFIRPSWIDQFELASLFGAKDRTIFYKKLIGSKADFDQLRSFFSFMQGHLFKIIDPSYINKKAKPSKYDKEILAHSKLWRGEELLGYIELFANFEILSKSKSSEVHHKLKQEYLNTLR